MARASRILGVMLALIVTGAILGGIAAAAAVAIVGSIIPRFERLASDELLIVAGAGMMMGAFVAPTFGWTVLRSAPLRRALVGPFVGTTLGAVLGAAVPDGPNYFSYGSIGALVGCLAGVYASRGPTRSSDDPAGADSRRDAV